MSVIDYLLMPFILFPMVKNFIVCNFTQFSDHAPLHVQLFTKKLNVANNANNYAEPNGNPRPIFSWDANCKHQFLESLNINSDKLKIHVLLNGNLKRGSIDCSVNLFTSELQSIMEPFFKKMCLSIV